MPLPMLPMPDGDDAASPPSPAALGLCFTSDALPGISRRRHGRGFVYRDPQGRRLADAATLAWIRALVVPPAWTEVWISPEPRGHLLATGRDARGRKQYIYHPRWRETREGQKFDRLLAFAAALPVIRSRVAADLGRRGLGRGKVTALVVRLLDETLVRVGNREYARENRSFGLTTLRSRHLVVDGSRLRLQFRGKGGKEWRVTLRSRRLAGLVRRLQELPGQELFRYLDEDGVPQRIDSDDVNAYLREVTGAGFTAKDFRTWWATVLACRELGAWPPAGSSSQQKRLLAAAIRAVAQRLGNTPAICRRSYVHPLVIEAWLGGRLPLVAEDGPGVAAGGLAAGALSADELRVLALLQQSRDNGPGPALPLLPSPLSSNETAPAHV